MAPGRAASSPRPGGSTPWARGCCPSLVLREHVRGLLPEGRMEGTRRNSPGRRLTTPLRPTRKERLTGSPRHLSLQGACPLRAPAVLVRKSPWDADRDGRVQVQECGRGCTSCRQTGNPQTAQARGDACVRISEAHGDTGTVTGGVTRCLVLKSRTQFPLVPSPVVMDAFASPCPPQRTCATFTTVAGGA